MENFLQQENNIPLDIIFSEARKRMAICRECPRLFQPTRTCMECGCQMLNKTKIPAMKCPLGHWESISTNTDTDTIIE